MGVINPLTNAPKPIFTTKSVSGRVGYGWVAGWALEVSWQAFFLLESPPGMWVCLVLIVGAFVAFGRTLLRLYG